MVATLVGVTLVAGLTSVPLVSGPGTDVTLSVSDAAAVRSLERVGQPPPVPAGLPVTNLPGTAPAAPPLLADTAASAWAPPAMTPPGGRSVARPGGPRPGATAEAKVAHSHSDTGVASWFGAPAGTCAHRTLPFGTEIRVLRLHDGALATCTVDDRGPTLETGRLIDLSTDTFEKLASADTGLVDVRIEW